MEYFIYENWTHKKAIVHRADCVCCNYGKGRYDALKYSERNGRWLGPFQTREEAKEAADRTKRKLVAMCRRCS